MAGNGGQMAKKFGAAKRGTKAGNKQAVAEPKQGKGRKPNDKVRGESDSEPDSKKNNRGGLNQRKPKLTHDQVKEKVQQEANLVLGRQTRLMTQGLMAKACNGDVRCVQLLFSLAAPTKESEQAAKEARLRKLIEAMENEPEWDSAMEEAARALPCGEPAASNDECGGVA